MTEYIRRNDAVKIAERYGLANGSVLGRHTGLADCIASEISALPAADVLEVVHGRWDDSGRYTFPNGAIAVRCTICGCVLNESEYRLYDWIYCPICGAKMDKCNEPEN